MLPYTERYSSQATEAAMRVQQLVVADFLGAIAAVHMAHTTVTPGSSKITNQPTKRMRAQTNACPSAGIGRGQSAYKNVLLAKVHTS